MKAVIASGERAETRITDSGECAWAYLVFAIEHSTINITKNSTVGHKILLSETSFFKIILKIHLYYRLKACNRGKRYY